MSMPMSDKHPVSTRNLTHIMLLSAVGPDMARPAVGAVTLSLLRVFLTAVLLLASLTPCSADPAPVIHYSSAPETRVASDSHSGIPYYCRREPSSIRPLYD